MIIDQLPLMSGNPQDDDEFPVERGTRTYKTKLQALAAGVLSKIVSSASPKMNGTAAAGTSSKLSRDDHVHPTDTSRASNSVIGIVQNTNTATQNISEGQYVIWKGALYTATAAIASGATLSSSNLTAVTGGGLNALLAEQGTIKNPFEIAASTDLNTMLVAGVYYSPLGSVSTTLLNYPGTGVAFSMLCLKALGGSVSLQIIITDERIYARRYGNGVWNSWRSYTGTIIQ